MRTMQITLVGLCHVFIQELDKASMYFFKKQSCWWYAWNFIGHFDAEYIGIMSSENNYGVSCIPFL